MPFLRLIALLLLGTLPAFSLPGEKLPDQFPDLSAQALVTSAVTTDDGSTFLMGNFTEADGITRPGLAKLTPNGHLDHSFAPPAFSPTEYKTISYSSPSHANVTSINRSPIFPLKNGLIMITGWHQWELRNSDGTLNTTLLPQFSRQSDAPPIPQFERNGRLYVVNRLDYTRPENELFATLTRYDSNTLIPDQTFALSPDIPAPPYQASPAADGRIWVLGRELHPTSPTSHRDYPAHYLFRLNSDGSLDSSFPPEDLSEHGTFALIPNTGPGLQLVSTSNDRYRYDFPISYDSIAATTRDQNGIPISIAQEAFNFGLSTFSHILPNGEILFQSLDYGDLLIRNFETREITFRIAFETLKAPPITRSITQFPNGKFLIGGNRRFLSDGSPDPNWHTTRLSREASISQFIPLRNGTILAIGDFDFANGLPRSGAITLNQNTTFDPSFAPDIDLRNARTVLEKNNGNLIALLSRGPYDDESNRLFLFELSSDGSHIGPVREPNNPYSWNPSFPDQVDQSNVSGIFIQSDNSLLVSSYYAGEVPRAELVRFPPNSEESEQMTVISTNRRIADSIIVLSDDRILYGRSLYSPEGVYLEKKLPTGTSPRTPLSDGSILVTDSTNYPSITLQKWHPDSGPDLTFGTNPLPERLAWSNITLTPTSTGKLLHWNPNYGLPSKLVRLHASGQLDPTFNVDPTILGGTYLPLETLQGPVIWIGAKSTGPYEPSSSLTVIDDSSVSGFESWIHATARSHSHRPHDHLPNSDPDQDGATNLFEYAASTDPFDPSPTHNSPRKISGLTFQAPCNPEAPEILRQIQTSTDLINWSPATANEVTLETSSTCLTWTLRPNAQHIYTRLRVLNPE